MPKKVREPIALRIKELQGGKMSLYLDTYIDGVRKHSYEFLKLYLVPEKTREDKERNRQTMEAAQAIRAQRLLERTRSKAGLPSVDARNITLIDYMAHVFSSKKDHGLSESTTQGVLSVAQHVAQYSGENTTLAEVTKNYCKGFIKYLSSARQIRHPELIIGKGTATRYFGIFTSVLSQAVRDGILSANPAKMLSAEDKKVISYPGAHKEYLTIDEVSLLAVTPCKRTEIKRAFMFACFCGLRISDLRSLRWANITEDPDGRKMINKAMVKTQQEIYLPLNSNALQWLPERGKPNDYVFSLPPNASVKYNIGKWVEAAGIKKHVTFHTSRHTFATMLLTKGADLYTTSKLLGHQDIKVTQVYADIIDSKRQDAVMLLDDVNIPASNAIVTQKSKNTANDNKSNNRAKH